MQTSGKNSPKGHVAELKNEFPLGWTGRIRFGCYLCLSLSCGCRLVNILKNIQEAFWESLTSARYHRDKSLFFRSWKLKQETTNSQKGHGMIRVGMDMSETVALQ